MLPVVYLRMVVVLIGMVRQETPYFIYSATIVLSWQVFN